MSAENSDLRKTNDRRAKRARRLADYRQRTSGRRDKRRLLELVMLGVNRGWIA